jgi:hypothetical protein
MKCFLRRHDAAATYGNALQCSPPKRDEPIPLAAPNATLRAVHSSGILCAYPTFDPTTPARLGPRAYRSASLSADAMAAINADLARATFTTRAPAPCGPSRHELTLRVETPGTHGPAGEHVEFVGTCLAVLRLSGNALWWRPEPSTPAVLAALMPAD